MKVKVDPGHTIVTLSERNLRVLLAKLAGHPKGSACSIVAEGVTVHAEPDDVHYAERQPGKMHSETEAAIKEAKK